MNINEVKAGLAIGKRFRRIGKDDEGRRVELDLIPCEFDHSTGTFSSFSHHSLTILGPFDSSGGVAELAISILPGRFEAEGWTDGSL